MKKLRSNVHPHSATARVSNSFSYCRVVSVVLLLLLPAEGLAPAALAASVVVALKAALAAAAVRFRKYASGVLVVFPASSRRRCQQTGDGQRKWT